MDYQAINLGLTLINMLVSGVIWIYVRGERKDRVTTQSIKALEKHMNERFQQKCDRIAKLEADQRAAPTKEDIIRIHERLDDTAKDSRNIVLMLGEISGQIKQMNEARK